ncbi:MAG: sulfatase [Akkermansiaceae bacterium]|nr:sulfatase [Akkermansiaceae bacterium]
MVIIYADDQGYHDLGCFGAPLNRTPNIDRIAAEGVRFTDFYSAYCVCSASRAALMTGCYQPRISMPGVIGPHSRTALNPDEVTIADLLKTKGYATACVGKWHLGDAPETLPTGQGFDRYFGIPYSNDMARKKGWGNDPEALDRIWREKRWDIYNNELYRDAAVIESPVNQTTLTERYAAEAVKFIEEKKDSPFFLYWANSMPHVPLFVSDDRYDPDPQQAYRLTVEHIDACVGKILDALDRTGAATNTLVVYTSDNGPWLSKKHHAGSALPLRDGKGTTWEGGMRVPCVMRWPARVAPGQECRQVASTIDLLPTLAALTGAALPEGRTIDGLDISALLADPAAPSPHDTAGFFYYKQNEIEAVRLGDWKLKFKVGKPELYNLRDDIGERRDLNKENPEKVGELKALAKAYDERLQAAKRPPWKAREAASSSSASTAPAPTDNLESEEVGGTESAPVVPQPPRRPGLRGRPIPRAIGKTVSLAAGLVRGVLGRGRTRS